MRVGICDDEKSSHIKLKRYIDFYAKAKAIPMVYIDFYSGNELLNYLSSNKSLDVIFMDYQMNPIDGLETSAKIIQKKLDIPVIFLTSFPEIVYESFKVKPFRFLVKPINYNKLVESFDNLLKLYSSENYVVVTNDEVTQKISINDIYYLEAHNKQVIVRLKSKVIYANALLSELESELPTDRFFRTHKSFIVGYKFISEYNTSEVLFVNNEKAKISRYKLSEFKKSYIDYMKRYVFEVDLP